MILREEFPELCGLSGSDQESSRQVTSRREHKGQTHQ